jgi:SlyX protein
MTDEAMMSRIEKLEERSAFQEHAIEELSETITDQWKLIDSLKRDIKRLTDELKEVEDNMAQGERREPPPPHY